MADPNTQTPPWSEAAKLMFEYFKHLTTLSTGSVLLLVTFLEKFFKDPEWRFLIGCSFGGFVLSILSSLIAMLMVSSFVSGVREPSDTERKFFAGGALAALASFFLAILGLVFFGLKNFY